MIVELGHFALSLAFALALVQMVVPIVGIWRKSLPLRRLADTSAPLQFVLIAFSFAALMWAHITSDFSVENVWANSHSAKPLLYKISGVWGNHEGSMLLWVLILVLFGAAVAVFGRRLPEDLRAAVLSVQAAVSSTFLLFILATSNPFARIPNPPIEGQGLNPILQDPALAIHPPLLYVGYVGFSIAFSFAIAALILGRIDTAWARWVRPWTLAAWIFLTIGIGVGSWWAYYTLGWGGWWFWDPVENASLMPWLTGTALLHSAIVMEKRESLKAWTVLLAIVTFSLSLLGTFLVRSGVLTSVHSFATDPARGVFILAILALFTGGGLLIFAWRASQFTGGGVFALISREGSLVLNNLLLTASCGVVFTGTLYPLLLEAITGDKISVGAPFFNTTVVWPFMLLLVALPFGIFLTWKRGSLAETAKRLTPALVAAAALVLVAIALGGGSVKTVLGLSLGGFVVAAAVWELLWRARFPKASLEETWRRLQNTRLSQLASTLGHVGLGVCVIGIAVASTWNLEKLVILRPGESTDVGRYHVVFKGVRSVDGPNYEAVAGDFEVTSGGVPIGTVVSYKKTYEAPPKVTTDAGISPRPLGDLYVVLGDESQPGAYSVRAYFHPFVRFIWGGALIMFIAGLVSLADRRLRIGYAKAPGKSAVPASPAPAE